MRDLQVIISDWHSGVDRLANAIKIKNFDFFSAAFRDCSRYFDELQQILESNVRRESLTEGERDSIVNTTRHWAGQVAGIEAWMAEIEAEAKTVHRNAAFGKKLTKAYNYIKTSGNNLRLSR